MIRRIKRFSPHQTAKVISLIYFPFGVLMAAVMGLSRLAPPPPGTEQVQFPVIVIVLLPILYSVIVYIFTALGCLMYNLGARWVGGIEVEVDDAPSA